MLDAKRHTFPYRVTVLFLLVLLTAQFSYADLPEELSKLIYQIAAPEPKESDYDERSAARQTLLAEIEKPGPKAVAIAQRILEQSKRSGRLRPTRSAIVVLERGLVKNPTDRSSILGLIDKALPPSTINPDPCEAVCRLATRSADWLSKQSLTELHTEEETIKKKKTSKEDIEHVSTAYLSLASLFLLRAAPYCPGLSDRASNLAKAIIAKHEGSHDPKTPGSQNTAEKQKLIEALKTSGVDSDSVTRAHEFLDRITFDNPVEHSHSLYAKNFLLQLAWETVDQKILSLDDVSPTMQKLYEALGREIDNGLKDVDKQGTSGSIFNTFTVSSALLTLGSVQGRKGITLLDEVRDNYESATNVPYYPRATKGYKPQTPIDEHDVLSVGHRSSAARAVIMHGTRWMNTPSNKKDKARQDLVLSLENFARYITVLRLHALREEPKPAYGWHVEGGEIAPYFFYPGMAYSLALLKELKKGSGVTKEEMVAFNSMEATLTGQLFAMIDQDGLFLPESDTTSLGEAKIYANPLGGFGLLAIAKRCNGKDVSTNGTIILSDADRRASQILAPSKSLSPKLKTHADPLPK